MFSGSRGWSAPAGLLVAVLTWGCLPPAPVVTDGATPADGSADGTADQNQRPVADAGQDQTATAGTTVRLDGTGSADADGDQLLFIWQQIDGEPDAELEGVFSSRPRFNAPQVSVETVLTFRLTVVDGTWAAADEVRVTVRPAP
ncbi:MAG TPA: PKD domain-containing protein [Phycisphaerae bacterium]|nr:PKD domain-containing protein [Phycisphaerae bacterium]